MKTRPAFSTIVYGFLLLAALFIPLSAQAAEITGRVVSIADGDTLTVLDTANTQHKIRLAEIDAPEIGHGANKPGQPFGQRSRQSLAELCFQKPATVLVVDTDRYGRTVGRVTCAGQDANAEQIRRGLAWVYLKYARDQSLYEIEAEARAARRGLWADPSPIPPWEWRRK